MAVYDRARIDDACLDFYCLEPSHLARPADLCRLSSRPQPGPSRRPGILQPGPIEIYTEPALPVNTDGEITTMTPATVRLLPKALNVIIPIGDRSISNQFTMEKR